MKPGTSSSWTTQSSTLDLQQAQAHVAPAHVAPPHVAPLHVAATFPNLAPYSVTDFSTLMQAMLAYQPGFASFCVRILDHMTLPGSLTVASLQEMVRHCTVPYCTVLCTAAR